MRKNNAVSASELTESGDLVFNVYAESEGSPIAGAKVAVFAEDGRQIEELTADSSGRTETITLPAPPLDYSQSPNMPRPYAEYDAVIKAQGLETLEIRRIQLFPDETAIQPANLNILEGENFGGVSSAELARLLEIDIAEHTLWGDYPAKIPEAEEKELPAASGFKVLDVPVIPQTIVVHDGSPTNTAAKNYYVPFKDYIKNVASSEIYSTWPTNTIRANVLAILSFTLNRVFTEWYRAKGRNFTITSSTAYDHAFFYGRTLYKEIVAVVDEIFTNYITRPNIRQPLFTQYCDGQKVQCPNWMTQWGSKDLGDRGYSTMNILRYFYGSDVYLETAPRVSGNPESYPGYNVGQGASGAVVRTIQNELNGIAKNYPAIPKVTVDGKFGPATAASVRKFQQVFNVAQSGVVDYPTWYRLSDIYTAVSKFS
ncbi:peptidoglycan-binding protein [Clostridia bacterium]|nr:peptidoglycan-binding protein [Clostridia bacterium]